MANYIESRIVDDGLTVRAVLGEIKRKQMPFSTSISVNTLYSYIEKGVFLRLSRQHLPFKNKPRKEKREVKPAKLPRGTSIEIRRVFPKGKDLNAVTPDEVKRAEDWLNNYPRGILGFDTPENLFKMHVSRLT